ncbi:MAG: hypothetical protein KAI73_05625 [Rhodospirillaceae bacterium]|nr:hypothetical protein [Rhodospirillaceae bacterium]
MINRKLWLMIPLVMLAAGLLAGSSAQASETSFEEEATGSELPQIAAMSGQFLKLEITSTCSDKGAIFKIVNRGEKWPRRGVLRLFHTDNTDQMSERKLRLASNQKVSFIIKKELLDGRPLGLWIEPEWYERSFAYDARINCN